MGMDARELEKMVISFLYGNISKLSEIKELGEELFKIIKQHVPYLVDNIEAQQNNDENPFKTLEEMVERPAIKIIDKPTIIDYTENAEEKVLKSHIMYHYQCNQEQAIEILNKMEKEDTNIREKLMHEILNKDENRELEQVNYTIQIPISLAVLTHFTRHRMQSLLVPEFTPMWNLNNYKIPDSIKNKGWESRFIDTVNKNIKTFEKFKNMGVAEEDLIYFYISGQMCNIITTMNARNIKWVCRMRACNKAQWEIRNVAKGIAKEVKEVSPLIGRELGPTCITNKVCYEGRESCGFIEKILENEKKKEQC